MDTTEPFESQSSNGKSVSPEEQYRLLFEENPESMWVYDIETLSFLAVNETAIANYGYTREEFLSMTIKDIRPPEDVPELLERIHQMEDKPTVPRVWCHRRRDGSLLHVEISSRQIEFAGRKARLTLAIDVTKRIESEQQKFEAEERFLQISKAISEVFWMTTPDLSRMIYLSPGYERVWCRSCQSAYDDSGSFWRAIHPEDREMVLNAILEKQLIGHDFEVEYRMIRPDGEIRWIWDRGFVIRDSAGTIHRLAGIAQDITERKRHEQQKEHLERQLRVAQKMEAIGQLAGGVAHDYNNTLMAINGFAELLEIKLAGNPDCQRLALEISKAASQGAELTRQLLAFSRQQSHCPKLVDMKQTIDKMRKMLERLIGEQIELRISADPQTGNIKADPSQIQQVVMNLAVNARDAMPNGGKLIIELSNIVLDAEYAGAHVDVAPGPYVLLAVSDTGHGMDDATAARIFEPFFTTKAEGKGTGLGLATVYGIVKQSRAQISVYSQLNHGTTFKIYFPRADHVESKESSKSESFEELNGNGEVILLVDDNDGVRKAVSILLEAKGYHVLSADNGNAAIEMSLAEPEGVDILITDMVMPEMSGTELSRRLHEKFPGLKVLYMSGYTQEAIQQSNIIEQNARFLSKPATAEAMLRKIRDLLMR